MIQVILIIVTIAIVAVMLNKKTKGQIKPRKGRGSSKPDLSENPGDELTPNE